MKTLMLCPWFGPFPGWWLNYLRNIERLADHGYDWLIDTDLEGFKQRGHDLLGIDFPGTEGGSKIHDWRAALGLLYGEELASYDFWGHTDLDCVYGRPFDFVDDERLSELDVFSDHSHYLCGPWALYRNTLEIAVLFMAHPDWRDILAEPTTTGWVETSFTDLVNASGLRVEYELNHGWTKPNRLAQDSDGRLSEDGREISFFHFRRTKRWPQEIRP